MLRSYKFICTALAMFLLTGCEDVFVNEEEAMFDTYYYFPGRDEPDHLGMVKGIDNCRLKVQSHRLAQGKRKTKNDYVCCLVTEKSTCAKRMQ